MIKGSSENFIQSLGQKTALSPLYKKKSLVVEIQSTEEPLWLIITDQGHEIMTTQPGGDISLSISAKDTSFIEQALRGERPLLALQEEGDIQVKGSFNHQLTLESLLILSSDHSFLVV